MKLEAQIERQLAAGLGYEVDTFVRRTDELAAVLQAAARIGPAPEGGSVHVGFLKAPPSEAQRRQLVACRTEVDWFSVEGREFYWRCGVGTAESKVWASAAMKAIKLPTFTIRNRTSLQKLAAKIGLPATDRSEP